MEVLLENDAQRAALAKNIAEILAALKLPVTVSFVEGRLRTLAQNKLQRQWMQDISKQTGFSPEEVRGYCKLVFGVPILRDASEGFREKYDSILKDGMPYENKLALMMEPLDLPVTRIMTVKQKTEYLNRIHDHFTAQGYALTDPEGEI